MSVSKKHDFIKSQCDVNKLFLPVASSRVAVNNEALTEAGYLTREECSSALWWCVNMTITVHLIFWFMVLPCGVQIHKYICHVGFVWTGAHQLVSHVLQSLDMKSYYPWPRVLSNRLDMDKWHLHFLQKQTQHASTVWHQYFHTISA